jgi:hypothetical protein
MKIVGLPYAFAGQMRIDEMTGGSPYVASTIARGDDNECRAKTSSMRRASRVSTLQNLRPNCFVKVKGET